MNAQMWFDRLDRLPPWRFTGTLYLARWCVIIPIAFVTDYLFGQRGGRPAMQINFAGALLLAPVLETLLECSLPYWIMNKLKWISDGRARNFVAVSAALMALIHFSAWPAALLPSLVTGGFLAYVYAHFAATSFRTAFLHTAVFHAGINIVGCVLIALG